MRRLLFLGFICFGLRPALAQTLTIKAIPEAAEVFRLAPDSSLVSLGTGTVQFKLQNKDPNTLVLRLEGYRDVVQSFVKGAKYKAKNLTIALTKRLIKIAAPADATIYINGENRGPRAAELELDEGQSASVEVKKSGFAPVRMVYRHERDADPPPLAVRVELKDRLVIVRSAPGARIFRDTLKVGQDSADVVVPKGDCVTVRAEKTGWIPPERIYCNKEGLTVPPLEDLLLLGGRMVNLVAPSEARIFVDGKEEGVGSASVRIREGTCVQVRTEREGFLPDSREYCVRDKAAVPPIDDLVALKPDDSYGASVPSEEVNLNLPIEIPPERTEEQAWRALAGVVLSRFDVLENSDRETGYLRTAWQTKSYSDGAVAIRTRVIVKRTGTDPLRYTVKISSERSRAPGVNLRDDESFEPWDRLLSTYKDMLAEMQARLRPAAPP